jgi:hypothetical protein
VGILKACDTHLKDQIISNLKTKPENTGKTEVELQKQYEAIRANIADQYIRNGLCGQLKTFSIGLNSGSGMTYVDVATPHLAGDRVDPLPLNDNDNLSVDMVGIIDSHHKDKDGHVKLQVNILDAGVVSMQDLPKIEDSELQKNLDSFFSSANFHLESGDCMHFVSYLFSKDGKPAKR